MHTKTTIEHHHSPSRVTLRPEYDQSHCVTIYWSSEKELQTDAMLEWLRLYPRKHDIHVYLPSVHKRRDHPRLQNTLQQLGCTVTARMCSV
ncbi:hypothetical protein KKC44_04910 [Patescibacteria group bacterium]|nr:hypothetical protein [Patescibacteria group bacterium]